MKKYIPILLIALSVAVGCKDFLVEEPPMAQSDVLTLSTYKGLNLCVAGSYAAVSSGSWYGKNMILRPEMATNGKKFIGTAFDTGRLNDYYSINYKAGNTSGLWGTAYSLISEVNRIMENLEGKGEPQDLDNLKAECLFLRALAHFDLCRVYARPYTYSSDASHLGVPIMLKYEDPGAASKPARNTVKEVYDNVIADLLEAEKIIDPSYAREGADQKAVVSLPVIQALLSRVYLYCENWAKSAEYATKVIECGQYELWETEDFKEAACYRQDVPKGGEIIFEVYDRNDNDSFMGNEGMSFSTNPDGYPDAGSSQELLDLYADGDVRKDLFQSRTNSKGESGLWTLKYAGKGMATPDYNNIVILRLSEMYLNRAEAGLHGVSGIDFVADMKAVASRRNATAAGASLEGLYLERRKEFAWEGQYWFDLYRTKRTLKRGEDYIGDPSGSLLEPSDFRWVQAIPVRELEQNENLEQNEGYQSK